MTPTNYSIQRMRPEEARKHLAKLMRANAIIVFTDHANERITERFVSAVSILNVLKSASSKIHNEGELKHGRYSYRVETSTIIVVIAFTEEGDKVLVITAMRR